MKRGSTLYIKYILEYMERAERHIKGLSFEDFLRDNKTCDAVIRCVEVIGEATKNIPDEIRSAYPSIPWNDMVVKEEVPRLKPLIKKVLDDLGKK